jgi:hypothetical protein
MYVNSHVCMYVCMYVCMRVHVCNQCNKAYYVCMYVCTHVCMREYVPLMTVSDHIACKLGLFMYACMYACMYAFVCVRSYFTLCL